MKFLHYEIDAQAGDTVEVIIDRAANVQLLDPASFENYSKGRTFRYSGGYATTSPVRLNVPSDGRWHIVIDLGGGPGHVKASVRILSGSNV